MATSFKKFTDGRCALLCIAAALFFACEKVPEYCGDGQKLNPETQFCFEGKAYDKCGGAEYDPKNHLCENGTMKTKCDGGESFYNPATEFCVAGTPYPKCGGSAYSPDSQRCFGSVVLTKCGDDFYDPNVGFCRGDSIIYPEITTHTLTVNRNPEAGGTVTVNGVASTGTTTHNAGASVAVTATANSDYTFTGWTGASTSTSQTITVTMSRDTSLTANFQSSSVTPPPPPQGDSFTDGRDGKVYRVVRIGGQTWMAENLNYATATGSWCYDNSNANCTKYGRLYNWETAKSACLGIGGGWHLPSSDEWNTLMVAVGGVMDNSDPNPEYYDYEIAGGKLKSKSGWNYGGNGTDEFGFSALPGGSRDYGYVSGDFNDTGDFGYWWSATEYASIIAPSYAYIWIMNCINDDVYGVDADKRDGFSVRCNQSL